MKQFIKTTILGTLCLFCLANCTANPTPVASSPTTTKNKTSMESNDSKAIKKVLKAYLMGGDKNDVAQLETVMHENFRVLLNDPNKGTVAVVDRATYLDLIGKKVFGGKPRTVDMESIDVYGGINAQVKVKLTSSEAIFYNYFSLIKHNGKWYVVQDFLYTESA